jgi:hypothetical protein
MASRTLSTRWKPWFFVAVAVALALGWLFRDQALASAPLVVLFGGLALWQSNRSVARLMQATRLSRKWTWILLVVFCLTPLGAGHGVAPVGLLLVLARGPLVVPAALGWLGIAAVGASPWVASWLGRRLAWAGVSLLTVAMVLFQMEADDALLGLLCSVPFAACSILYELHLLRITRPSSAQA